MSALDWLVFVGAMGALVGCICRLDPMKYWKHRFWIVGFHVALASACIWAAGSAWQGHTGIRDCMIVGATIAWLYGSWLTWWHAGVPWFAMSTPVERRRYDERRQHVTSGA